MRKKIKNNKVKILLTLRVYVILYIYPDLFQWLSIFLKPE